jgi:hypothetical protein
METPMSEPAAGFTTATFADTLPRAATTFNPSNLQTDPLEFLPPGAADRLRALRQAAADAHALMVDFGDLHELSTERRRAVARLEQLTGHPQDSGLNLPTDHRSVIDAGRSVARLTSELDRLKQQNEQRTARWRAASAVLAAVEAWIAHGIPGNCMLKDADATEPAPLKKGETVVAAIARVRHRGRELRADLHRIRSAPYPSDHCKTQMRAQVATLAEHGAASVTALVEHDGEIGWPSRRLRSQTFGAGGAIAFAETTDALGLLAWLCKDLVVAALDAAIDFESDDGAALSVEARQQAEVEVMADLLSTEREECALVLRAQSEGLAIDHRIDCAPAALLAVELVTRAAAVAVPTELAAEFMQPRSES